jgi:hypothetical protein
MTSPGVPSKDATALARQILKVPDQVLVTTDFLIPAAQWRGFSIHVEIGGGTNFTLRVRWADLDGNIYDDGGDPAVDDTLHVGGTRIRYVVTPTEHVGEPFVVVTIASPTGVVNIINFDIYGTPN